MVRKKLNPLQSPPHTKYLLLISNKHDTIRAIRDYRNRNSGLFDEANKKKSITDNAIRKLVTPLLNIGILRQERNRGKEKPFTINYLQLLDLLLADKISTREKELEKYNLHKEIPSSVVEKVSGEYAGDDIKELKQLKTKILKISKQENVEIKFKDVFEWLFFQWENNHLIKNKVYTLREIFDSWLLLLKDLKEGDSVLVDSDGRDIDSRVLKALSDFAYWALYPLEFKDPFLHHISQSVLTPYDSTAFLKSRS